MFVLAITGSSGFIGGYVSKLLPFPQTRLVRKAVKESSDGNIRFVVGDLSSQEAIENFLEGAKSLIHLAWGGSPRTPLDKIQDDIQDYLIPTYHLFRRFAEKNPQGHIIFSSSGGNIYGNSPGKVGFSEEDIPCPLSSYSLLKLNAENYLPLLCEKFGVRATIMRISNPYGTLLPGTRGQGLIGVAFSKILANEPIKIFDDLNTIRDYLHLRDLSRAFQAILDNPPKNGVCNIYNVSSFNGYSIRSVLKLMEEITTHPVNILLEKDVQTLSSSPKKSILSNEKIKNELAWQPKTSLKEGLEEMWHDLKNTRNEK